MSGPGLDVKEQVRQATDIVALIGASLPLRRQGAHYVAHCPWHDDRRPSLQVNPARQSWKCWVCNIGGDVFSFVMRRENVDFGEALRLLASRAGIRLQRGGEGSKAPPDDKLAAYEAMRWVVGQYHHYLSVSEGGAVAREYLAARGVSPASIERFQLGYAPDARHWLQEQAASSPHRPEVLKACGVLADAASGGTYERFRGRVIFPIFDVQQRPVGLGGRILPEVAERQRSEGQREPAKYVNTPETRLFSKSDQLYGLHLVRDAAARPEELVVVEGYTDVIAAWQSGLDNVVAVLGTALNTRHLRLMRRFVERVVLVLDGDAAGRKRAAETLDLFLEAELDLRVVTLPDELDPCDFLARHSAAAFRERVASSVDALEHKLALELSGIDVRRETHRAQQALEAVLQTMARRPSHTLVGGVQLREQQLLSRLAREFELEPESVRRRLQELRGRVRPTANRSAAPLGGAEGSAAGLDAADGELFELLLQSPELLSQVVARVQTPQRLSEPARTLFAACCRQHAECRWGGFETLITEFDDPGLKSLLVDLDERAQAKAAFVAADEVHARLELLLAAIERRELELDNRQAISRLHHPLDPQEETETLLEILERARRRQGLSAPTEG